MLDKECGRLCAEERGSAERELPLSGEMSWVKARWAEMPLEVDGGYNN